jgi:site-specific recombinase XerD
VTTAKRPPEVLTPEEARALVYAPSERAPTGVRNRALIATLYGAGLRLREALEVRTFDFLLDAGEFRILHGKGDESRVAHIDEGALVHVARWVDLRRARAIPGRVLFCTLSGGALSPRYVRAMLNRMAARAGIERRVHPHGLRHTHAAELERDGVSVTVIQKQLGHKSLSTTQIYLDHISPTARGEILRKRRTVL